MLLCGLLALQAPGVARADDDTTYVKPDVDLTPRQGTDAPPQMEARPNSDIYFSVSLGGGVAQSGPVDPSQNQSTATTPGFMGRLVFRTLAPLGELYSRPQSCEDETSTSCSEGGFLFDFHTILETTMTNSFVNPYYWEWEQTVVGGRHRWSQMHSGGFGAEIGYLMLGAYFRDGTDLQYHIKTAQLTLLQAAVDDGFPIGSAMLLEVGANAGLSLGAGQYQYYGLPNAFLGLHEWVGAEIALRFPAILRISLSSYFRRIDATNFSSAENGLMFWRNQISFERPGDLPISIDGRLDVNWRVSNSEPGLFTWSALATYYYP